MAVLIHMSDIWISTAMKGLDWDQHLHSPHHQTDNMECESDVSQGLNYPSVVDRYYRRMYKLDNKGHTGEDHCVLVHSNRICIVTLAPSHPIIKDNKVVTAVNFQINKRTNRLENTLSGKRKRGAQPLADNSALCIVRCSDGSEYQPCACVKGSLIEANENLVSNPQLLTKKTDTEGYIAIALTKLQEHKKEIGALLTQEEYDAALAERSGTGQKNGTLNVTAENDPSHNERVADKDAIIDVPRPDTEHQTLLKASEDGVEQSTESSSNKEEADVSEKLTDRSDGSRVGPSTLPSENVT